MRFYLKELNKPDKHNLYKLHTQKEINELYLTENGIYKMEHDKLYQFKIKENTNKYHIDNYITGFTFISSGYELCKIDNSYKLPYNHQRLIVEKEYYSLYPQSQTLFIIEKYPSCNYIDYYFESPLDPKDFSLKEDIISLLSHF